jgi:hypothetical protein
MSLQNIKKGEENWFIICSLVINKMISEGFNREILIKTLISHMVETLTFENSILLLNYLFDESKSEEFSDIIKLIKQYYDSKLLTYRNNKGLIVLKDGKQQLIVYNNNKWIVAESEDYNDFSNAIKGVISNIRPLNNVVGFIGLFKNDYLIFKVKTMDLKRNKGARCDQSGKIETIKTLNRIYGEEKYNKENTKGISQIELCIRQELTLRIFDNNKKEGKRWFLTPSEAVLINIEKMTL